MDFLTAIANYGFPAVVAIFLLLEYREIRRQIMNEIHSKLMDLAETQKQIADSQRQIAELQKQILETQKEILELQRDLLVKRPN